VLGLATVQNGTKLVKMTTQNLPKMTSSVAKGKGEIFHVIISFAFPITVADENFNIAGALLHVLSPLPPT
jgi:hypothetical protein